MGQSIHNKIFSDTGCVARDKLVAYHNDGLATGDMHLVEKHLLDCELCTDALDGFMLVPAAVAGMDQIDIKIKELVEQQTGTTSKGIGIKILVAAGIAALLVSSIFVINYNQEQKEARLAQQMPQPEETQVLDNIPQAQTALAAEKFKDDSNLNEASGAMGSIALEDNEQRGGGVAEDMEEEIAFSDVIDIPDKLPEPEDFATLLKASGTKHSAGGKEGKSSIISREDRSRSSDGYLNRQLAQESKKNEEKAKRVRPELAANKRSKARGGESTKPVTDYWSTGSGETVTEPRSVNQPEKFAYTDLSKSKGKAGTAKKSANTGTNNEIYLEAGGNDYKVVDYTTVYVEDDKDATVTKSSEGISARYESEEKMLDKKTKEQQDEVTINLDYDRVLTQGLAKYDAREYNAALDQFNFILKQQPNDMNALYYSAMSNYQLGNASVAKSQFGKVISDNNEVFQQEANYYQALNFEQMGDTLNSRPALRTISNEEGFYQKKARTRLDLLELK